MVQITTTPTPEKGPSRGGPLLVNHKVEWHFKRKGWRILSDRYFEIIGKIDQTTSVPNQERISHIMITNPNENVCPVGNQTGLGG